MSASACTSFLAAIRPRVAGNAGCVSLVGAGPGDAGLLTLKALRAIEAADVVFYDRLVSEDIRALIPASTPSVYVGKAVDRHAIPQHQLNALLVQTASLGLNVCRLKGGDVFVFGRGGEEMLELKAAGIAVQVVPGITAGIGATAYAGIPLTHRGLTQGVSFVTAHGEKSLNLNWQSLAQSGHTLVFYMGLSEAQVIADRLQAGGMAAHMPAAIIEKGCSSAQRVFCAPLSAMPALVTAHRIASPALIVVGQVVQLREQLQWLAEMPAGADVYTEQASAISNNTFKKLSA